MGCSTRADWRCRPRNASWTTSSARSRSIVIAVASPTSLARCWRNSASTSVALDELLAAASNGSIGTLNNGPGCVSTALT